MTDKHGNKNIKDRIARYDEKCEELDIIKVTVRVPREKRNAILRMAAVARKEKRQSDKEQSWDDIVDSVVHDLLT